MKQNEADRLVCNQCGVSYPLNATRWRCGCGALLDIQFAPVFDLDKIERRKPTMWRYREAIPIQDDAAIVSFDEGFTPLLPIDFDGRPVWIKQEQLFSTGSYKDRGASVLISQVNALGIKHVVEDSSGNAGCAIAAYCAAAGVACDIYVPAGTSPAKLAQIEAYGAHLHKIPGRREDTARAVRQAAETVYYASHAWNPFFFHGAKTFAFEVCEQLGWRAPDVVILPVGNGTLLLGAAIGFQELAEAGIMAQAPCLIGVQAEACAPLCQPLAAECTGSTSLPIDPRPTIAEGIAIAAPVRGPQIVRAVQASGGEFIAVSEAEIAEAWRAMGQKGLFIEPTAAAAVAGVARYVRAMKDVWGTHDPVIVSALTGHGLKAAGHVDLARVTHDHA